MNNKDINILIVEDEIFSSKYLSGILNSLGFKNIREATNAQSALDIVKSEKIELVFMDINIDGAIDGIQCSELLNKEYAIPVIFTTAYGDSQTIKEASRTNLFGYLVKPFESHDLEAVLSVTLKRTKQDKKPEPKKDTNVINLGKDQTYNLSSKTCYIKNIPVHLTKKELELLDTFCKNLNQNIPYDILKLNVWDNLDISDSTLRDTVARLKRKVPELNIENIINYGYILKHDNLSEN